MAEGQTKSPPHEAATPSRDAVRCQLQQVLSSPEFRASKRCQDFLSYVVEAAIDGRADSLKERTIGVDVFSRSSSYDPSEDATVRVKAGDVRKRLGLYYATEGASDRIRIDLPAGTYVPQFRVVEPAAAADRRRKQARAQPPNPAPAVVVARLGCRSRIVAGAPLGPLGPRPVLGPRARRL